MSVSERRVHKEKMRGKWCNMTCPECGRLKTLVNGYGHHWCGNLDCEWGTTDIKLKTGAVAHG